MLTLTTKIIGTVTALSDSGVGGASLELINTEGEMVPLDTIKQLSDENYCTYNAERLDDLVQSAVVILIRSVLHCCHAIFGS